MSLSFENTYSNETAYVALVWFDDTCNPHTWRKMGWFHIPPGETVVVFPGDLQELPDRNWAWFAQLGGADGPCWSGDPRHHYYSVPHNLGFNQCFDNNSGCNAAYPFVAAVFNPEWVSMTVILLFAGEAGLGFQGSTIVDPTLINPPPPPPPPPQPTAWMVFPGEQSSLATVYGSGPWPVPTHCTVVVAAQGADPSFTNRGNIVEGIKVGTPATNINQSIPFTVTSGSLTLPFTGNTGNF